MKASALLLTLFLIAAGCSDATNIPSGLTAPSSASGARVGNVPPPPADVAVAVCTTGGCAVFEGTYMSNGTTDPALTAAITASATGDGVCAAPGHASLKIDKPLENQFFDFVEGTTSANAQIKCHQQIATGNGTLEIGGVVVNFDQVDFFNNQPDCGFLCGQFIIRDEQGNDIATGIIVERAAFDEAFCYVDGGEGGPGTPQCYSGSEG